MRGEGGKGNEGLGDQHNEPYSNHKEQDTEEQEETGKRDTILCALRKRTVVQYTPCPIVRPMNMICQRAQSPNHRHATAALILCIMINNTNNQSSRLKKYFTSQDRLHPRNINNIPFPLSITSHQTLLSHPHTLQEPSIDYPVLLVMIGLLPVERVILAIANY